MTAREPYERFSHLARLGWDLHSRASVSRSSFL